MADIDRCIDLRDRFAQGIVLPQIQFEHEAMVVRQSPMQCIVQDLG